MPYMSDASATSQNPQDKQTMTLKDAGKLIGVSGETLRRQSIDRSIPSIRIGDRHAVPRVWVNDLLNGQQDRWSKTQDGTWIRTDPTTS
jgi:hypothetical protein